MQGGELEFFYWFQPPRCHAGFPVGSKSYSSFLSLLFKWRLGLYIVVCGERLFSFFSLLCGLGVWLAFVNVSDDLSWFEALQAKGALSLKGINSCCGFFFPFCILLFEPLFQRTIFCFTEFLLKDQCTCRADSLELWMQVYSSLLLSPLIPSVKGFHRALWIRKSWYPTRLT